MNYSILIITQFLLGKKGAFVYALFLDMNLFLVSFIIILCDIALMFLVGNLLRLTTKHVFPFSQIQRKAENREEKFKKSKFAGKILSVGKAGTLIICAIPFAGGVWSGMILAKILQLNKIETYWLVTVGSIIGCFIFLLAAMGIINLI